MKDTPGVLFSEVYAEKNRKRVFSQITVKEDKGTAPKIVLRLRQGNPSIWVSHKGDNKIVIDPSNLQDKEEKILVQVLKKVLKN
jgi:ribosome biogenesis GTPase A